MDALHKVGQITFEFVGDPELMDMHVFCTDRVQGTPVESDGEHPGRERQAVNGWLGWPLAPPLRGHSGLPLALPHAWQCVDVSAALSSSQLSSPAVSTCRLYVFS